jgi:hypothetical protein
MFCLCETGTEFSAIILKKLNLEGDKKFDFIIRISVHSVFLSHTLISLNSDDGERFH